MENNETKTNPSKRNATIGAVFGVIAFGAAYFGVQQLFFKTPSFDKAMMEAASQINASCPIMVDNATRLDNAAALPGNIFQYNYTLVSMEASAVPTDTLRKYLEPNIINSVKTNPDLQAFRDNKVTMEYNYKDMNGIFLVKISVTPDLYQD